MISFYTSSFLVRKSPSGLTIAVLIVMLVLTSFQADAQDRIFLTNGSLFVGAITYVSDQGIEASPLTEYNYFVPSSSFPWAEIQRVETLHPFVQKQIARYEVSLNRKMQIDISGKPLASLSNHNLSFVTLSQSEMRSQFEDRLQAIEALKKTQKNLRLYRRTALVSTGAVVVGIGLICAAFLQIPVDKYGSASTENSELLRYGIVAATVGSAGLLLSDLSFRSNAGQQMENNYYIKRSLNVKE